eukprot:gnl/TRDRNA2_/TRDRNA2_158107_c0_seq4.p2 gnl/TRDRNA2_/TRDRNA2_158107_c0~~gnl/TRDRNA2_/TRDRNA2_158107_c0_seq4.p2  ORF type:complete len:134 (-),score=11.96 gnl/TRDRNA2_/TRDRNA2_158107_c0_seq4:143-544(-)
MTTFGGWYDGPLLFYILKSYAAIAPAACKATPLRQGVFCTILDNFVTTPFFYLPIFFVVTGALEGLNIDQAFARLQTKWWPSLRACWFLYVPAMGLNFGIVPAHFRVLFCNVVNLIWNIIIDFVAHLRSSRTG